MQIKVIFGAGNETAALGRTDRILFDKIVSGPFFGPDFYSAPKFGNFDIIMVRTQQCAAGD